MQHVLNENLHTKIQLFIATQNANEKKKGIPIVFDSSKLMNSLGARDHDANVTEPSKSSLGCECACAPEPAKRPKLNGRTESER